MKFTDSIPHLKFILVEYLTKQSILKYSCKDAICTLTLLPSPFESLLMKRASRLSALVRMKIKCLKFKVTVQKIVPVNYETQYKKSWVE